MASFRDRLSKSISKVKGASLEKATPKFWLSSGNYCINKVMSGHWERAVPQGRVTMFAGPSGSGKSFIISNVIKQALSTGFCVAVLDSEHALDDEYLQAVGVDTDSEDYFYASVKNMSSGVKSFQKITKEYTDVIESGGSMDDLPKVLIVVDSLDLLFVDGMLEEFEKSGEMGSDQGLHSKKMKQFLDLMISNIKHLPVAVLVTKHVYVDQTKYASPPWKMAEAIKYAVSQLMLVTRLLMKKEEGSDEVKGIRLKVFGWKTRFTKPFQQVEIVVPYDTGLDPYEGILSVAKSLGIVTPSGNQLVIEGEKFFAKNFKDVQEKVFEAVKNFGQVEINAISDDVVEEMVPEKKAKAQTRAKLKQLVDKGLLAAAAEPDGLE
jgi:RecA/RadA recombinase